MIRYSLRLNKKEYLAAYILASLSNLFLIIPFYQITQRGIMLGLTSQDPAQTALVSTYGVQMGLLLDALRTTGVYQVSLAIIVLGTALTGVARKMWKWQYILASALFSVYVGYRLVLRFNEGLEWVASIGARGIDTSGMVISLYLFSLGAAFSYFGLILVLRRAYGRLVTVRSSLRAEPDQSLIITP